MTFLAVVVVVVVVARNACLAIARQLYPMAVATTASLCRPVTGTIFLVLESGDSGGGGDGSNSIGGGGGVAVAVAVTVGRRCTVTPYSRQTDS